VISWRAGHVTALGRAWRGARELTADVEGTSVKALAYPPLTGEPSVGDRVLLNTTAQTMGLGTGGYKPRRRGRAIWSRRATRRSKPLC
jgi:hypothetical protein